MHRRNYVEIAETTRTVLAQQDGPVERMAIAEYVRALVSVFYADNPRFDRQRFYDAAGLDENGRVREALFDIV